MLTKLLYNTTLEQWIDMPYDDFYTNIVEPLNMMDARTFDPLIRKLPVPQFEMLRKKCWEEQDVQPSHYDDGDDEEHNNEDGDDGEHNNDDGDEHNNDEAPAPDELEAYDKTLPIVILLENMLSVRIEHEQDQTRKLEMAKQLTLLNIILSTHLVEGLADKIQ